MSKKIQKKISFFCFLLTIISNSVFAQQKPVEALQKLYDKYPQEKIYLWYNKASYIAGETIWFKGYVFSGYDVSLISTTLYVELYDADKKLIITKMLPLISGVADGSIELASKLNEGVYYIRAYTTWMLNFNAAFQYIHSLLVYNTAPGKKLTLNNSLWKAAAVPEGGTLIDGLETKVAVRRFATASLGTKWGGYLYEEENPTAKLKEFSSLDENVALFSFTPEARKKYHVYVKDESSNYQVVSLPLVQTTGVSFSIIKNSDSITYQLRFQNIPGNGQGYSVLAEVQHEMVYNADLKKVSPELTLNIPAEKLGNGIVHLTVFDAEKRPVAERLVFLNLSKLNYDNSVLLQQTLSAKQREKNELQLTVDSVNWISYTVSVNDASTPSSIDEENILSAVWLTSDLINPIQRPAQYFANPGKTKAEALDAIMISEKWNRFDWSEIINNQYPPLNFKHYQYLSFKGTVTRGRKLKSNEEVNLFLRYPDSSLQFMMSKTDSNGNIILNNLAFYGEMNVYYQLNSKKSFAKLIEINFERNNLFVPYSLPLPETPYTLSVPSSSEKKPDWIVRAGIAVNIEKEINNKYKNLQEVTVRSKLKSATDKLNEKLSSGFFTLYSDIIFDFINDPQKAYGYSNILEWLQSHVAGLTLGFQDGNSVPFFRGRGVSLYIDEWPADPNRVSSLSISDIAMIKFNTGPFGFFGGGAGSAVIAIYTARGDLRPVKKEPSFPSTTINGYDVVKKFYSPDYDDNSKPNPDKDTRDQLLWQTLLPPTLAKDKSKVVFFNNDNTKRFKVIVQGFKYNGSPVYFEKVIEPPSKTF